MSEWTHKHAAGAVALSRDRRLALVGAGRDAVMVDAEALAIRRSWRGSSLVTAVALSPDGRRAFMGFADGAAILCDVRLPERSQRGATRTSLTRDGGCW